MSSMDFEYLKHTFQLSEIETTILRYLEDHFDSNIRQVAAACYTSPATIIRLAKKFHLKGYNELVYKIKNTKKESKTLQEFLPTTNQVNDFCQLLKKNQNRAIILIAVDFSKHLADFMSDVFNFHLIPAITTPYPKLLQKNKEPALLIFISHSGEDHQLCNAIKKEKNDAIDSIAFVGNQHSTIGQEAKLTFSTNSYSPFSTDNAQPQNFFGLTLIIFEHLISNYLNLEKNK